MTVSNAAKMVSAGLPKDTSAVTTSLTTENESPFIFNEKFIDSFDSKEFACGCGAAFINIGVTYPIYKMIFRQMLHGVRMTSAFDQLRFEGLGYLYRGMLPPLAQKTVSLSIMFGVFDGTRRYMVEKQNFNEYSAKIIAGLVSGTVETIFLPFERVQCLLAHSRFHQHFGNTALAFRYVLRHHGFFELYRGLVPILWRNGPSNAMFFILREEAIIHLPKSSKMPMKAMQEFFSGAFIGATISTIFYPLNVIKVSMQSDMGHKSESLFQNLSKIYRERGYRITEFYRGCTINSFRSFISWGIMNAAYENLKSLIS